MVCQPFLINDRVIIAMEDKTMNLYGIYNRKALVTKVAIGINHFTILQSIRVYP